MFARKLFLNIFYLFALLLLFQSGIARNSENEYAPETSFKEGRDTVRLFFIGNSFSQNASTYLQQLANEGGHVLIIGRAELGGCSLQRHWEIVEAAEADPNDPKGKQYNGKSLKMLVSTGKWDVISIQQNSMNSADVNTYRPYAKKLYNYIKDLQPDAKIVIHQTWAYRSDSKDFSQISEGKYAKDDSEMWMKSRAAYHTIAKELGIRIVPVGDAFRTVASDPYQAYKKDVGVFSGVAGTSLPAQEHSLNVGYYRDSENILRFDSHHANAAGCYLGSLVWYKFIFKESPEKLTFKPSQVPDDFAVYLRKVAASKFKRLH